MIREKPFKLADDLAAEVKQRQARGAGRIIIAVFGPPAAGKTTTSDMIAKALNAAGARAGVISQDGFHYDNSVLEARGLLSRKGAQNTFDVDGLASLLARLRKATGDIAVPVFDRDLEVSRNAAAVIGADRDVVICEGNYLLLEDPAWTPLRAYFDMTVALTPPLPVIRARLEARWLHYGYSDADARKKIEENDLPNAEMVLTKSAPADFVVTEFDED